MPLRHDLVHHTFDPRTPKDHVRILADHADEEGHPELATALRNEKKSVNPYPWYDDDYGSADRDIHFEPGVSSHPVTPNQHLNHILKRGHELAPGIFALKGYDGFGPAFRTPENNGFHVYDLRNVPDEEDQPGFGSRALHNAALEEHWTKNPPRFFQYSGKKLELNRDIPESLTSLYHQGVHGGDNQALRVLADEMDERGHPLLATIFRRGAGYREKFGTEYPAGPHPYLSAHHTTGVTNGDNHFEELYATASYTTQRRPWIAFNVKKPDGKGNSARTTLRVPLRPEEHDEYREKYTDVVHARRYPNRTTGMDREHTSTMMNLARPDVIAEGMSEQQKQRKRLALQIAREAALRLEAIYDARTQNNAGVLQVFGHDNEPEAVDYAAAWYGLLTREPKLTTFHVHDGGPDTYHSWDTGLDPDKVLVAARELGLDAVVTSKGKVSVLDHGNQLAAPISRLKETSYARATSAEPGTARRLHSRDEYRATIQRYSSGTSATGGDAKTSTPVARR